MAISQARAEIKPNESVHSPSLLDSIDIANAPSSPPVNKQPRGSSKATFELILNRVFNGDGWRSIDAKTSDDRADQCAGLFRKVTGAKWGTHLRMLDNQRIRYFLLHLTNHSDGRDLMKECMWKACPAGGFFASKQDNPQQRQLIESEPDLDPVYEWIKQELVSGPKRWLDLSKAFRDELWLDKHLNQAIRSMQKGGEIRAEGKFAQSHNPLLHLESMF